MNTIFIVGCIVVSIILGVVTYFICDALFMASAGKKINFTDSQKKIKQQLIEKEETYEKEQKAQLDKKINEAEKVAVQELKDRLKVQEKEALEDINTKVDNAKQHFSDLEKRLEIEEENYNKKVAELESYYEGSVKAYQDLDKQREEARALENQAKIEKEQEEYLKKLSKIKDDYELEKKEMSENFQLFSEDINSQKAILAEEIEAFEKKQKAIIEQFKHDEEIRQKRDYYHISISDASKRDIKKLKELSESFSKPEVLLKLIYEVYYKTPLEELFKRVLGENKDKGGIYKITNINNEKIYIGKSTNFLNRFRTHAKRGCGIERIRGLLYDNMFEDGLENYTWEIVEVCPREIQTEREKYWIRFYSTTEYGYNIKEG